MSLDVESIGRSIVERCGGPLFAVPGGGSSLDLMHAVAEAGMDVVVSHTETSAAIMAATVGRLTGRPGVATSIRGPGVAALAPGLAFAALEGDPVVSLSETPPDPERSQHKWMDHAGLLTAVAKQYGACSDGTHLDQAVTLAQAPRPGPVALDLSDDLRKAFRPDVSELDPRQPVRERMSTPRQIIDLLERASRPIVLVGAGARHQNLGPWLMGLTCPVATTAAAKGLMSETSANSAGVFTGSGGPRSPEVMLLDEADVLLRIGVHPHELLGPLEPGIGPTLDLDPIGLQDSFRDELGRLFARTDADYAARAKRSQELRTRLVEATTFLPASALGVLAARVSGSPRLVVDTGDFCTVAEHAWLATDEASFLGAGCSRFMGAGVAMALACGLVDPQRPTVLALGDGGVGPSFGELTLAAERRLPVLILLLSDGGFASIRGRARSRGLPTRHTEFPERAWWRAAQSLGIGAVALGGRSAADDLQAAADAWNPVLGPLFISIRFETEPYQRMTEGLR